MRVIADPASRPPLDTSSLADLAAPWTAVEVLDALGSTNAALADRARAGAPTGSVLVVEHQSAGRGRLDRSWVTPPRAALTFSALLEPPAGLERTWSWLPLLAGVATVEALQAASGVRCRLKWPNDVLLDGRKIGGLLVELVEPAPGLRAVLGIGLNVTTRPEELPVAEATSLAVAGVDGPGLDRGLLLRAVLDQLGARYLAWVDDPEAATLGWLAEEYTQHCDTLGRAVRADLPGGSPMVGVARSIGADGSLVLETTEGLRSLSAGDVRHLRPEDLG